LCANFNFAEFEGLTYPERFLVVSTDYPFERYFPDLRWVNYVSDPDEWCVMLKTRDLWRIQFPTPVEMSEEELLSDSFIEDRLQRLHAKQTPSTKCINVLPKPIALRRMSYWPVMRRM